MIKTTLLIISLFFTQITLAFQNPLIRDCRLAGGLFTEVKTHNDQVGLCEFGQSYIGALDVLEYTHQINVSQSIRHYKNNITSCAGQVLVAQVLNTKINITVCQYPDGSFIDLKTLTNGSSDPNHAQLNQFLGL